MVMPGACVIVKFGVPLVAYNTATNFHQVSQMFKDPKDVKRYTGGEFEDENIRGMNMVVIIALAKREEVAVEQGCIERRNSSRSVTNLPKTFYSQNSLTRVV